MVGLSLITDFGWESLFVSLGRLSRGFGQNRALSGRRGGGLLGKLDALASSLAHATRAFSFAVHIPASSDVPSAWQDRPARSTLRSAGSPAHSPPVKEGKIMTGRSHGKASKIGSHAPSPSGDEALVQSTDLKVLVPVTMVLAGAFRFVSCAPFSFLADVRVRWT